MGHYRNTSNPSLANDLEMPVVDIFGRTFEVLIALFGAMATFWWLPLSVNCERRNNQPICTCKRWLLQTLEYLHLHFLLGYQGKSAFQLVFWGVCLPLLICCS